MERHTSRIGSAAGCILACLPLGFFIYLALYIGPVTSGGVFRVAYEWVPYLGIRLSFYLDGLSLIFSLLISGIGTLVILYGSGYLSGHHQIRRFYVLILFFMLSMLGLVLADNLITLFVFWELTSISSYLLIGFHHERKTSQAAALQALLVTSAGGLALLAGFILLGTAGSSLELSQLLSRGDIIRGHGHYGLILFLVLFGVCTKSAQVPFHFWLPNAMAAPAPVSAYLHSSTMVKAGVYLLARLNPVLGGTEEWHYYVTLCGAATMLTGAVLALFQTDIKRLLAYSTVSALGTLVLLLGLSTNLAAKAAMVFLLVHSLYKGALFMVAGAVDHQTGMRDIRALEGLRRVMPISAAVALAAGLSMAGLPPLLGFIGKELLYEAKLQAPMAAIWITGAGVLANALMVCLAGMVCIKPFFGSRTHPPRKVHEAHLSMWLGPMVLAALGLVIGLFPDTLAKPLVAGAVTSLRTEKTVVKLALWHGLNPVLALSVVTVLSGAVIYLFRREIVSRLKPLHTLANAGPGALYQRVLDGMLALAGAHTRILQNGYLRYYMITILVFTLCMVFIMLMRLEGFFWPKSHTSLNFYETALGALILTAALAAVRANSRLGAVAALGVVGYGVALFFIFYSAPDLAITQILVETLMVILFVLVIYHLPRFRLLGTATARWRDIGLSLAAGGVIAVLVMKAAALQLQPSISGAFLEKSVPLGHGRNVVNVILVDFRAIDTLGEIAVLTIASLGVFALLKLRDKSAKGGEGG